VGTIGPPSARDYITAQFSAARHKGCFPSQESLLIQANGME
jgi:hypothetical protein